MGSSRKIMALLVAVLLVGVLGSVVQTQYSLAAISAGTIDIVLSVRLALTLEDVIRFGPVMCALAAAGLIPALLLADRVTRHARAFTRLITLAGCAAVGMWCVFAGLMLGVVSGFINGFVIARLKINALITTLATMQIVRGLAYIISDGKAVGIEDESFFTLGYANWLGLPAPSWLTVACLIVFGFLLNRTTFGRNTLAIGGNEEAARLAGVPVVRTKIIIFVLSGLVSAIAGIILASRMTSGQPMTSIGYELIVISACVLGGVSLKGGIGKISYVVAGVLILGTVENAMNLLNISPFSQYVLRGLILLAAVIFDRYKQKAKRTV